MWWFSQLPEETGWAFCDWMCLGFLNLLSSPPPLWILVFEDRLLHYQFSGPTPTGGEQTKHMYIHSYTPRGGAVKACITVHVSTLHNAKWELCKITLSILETINLFDNVLFSKIFNHIAHMHNYAFKTNYRRLYIEGVNQNTINLKNFCKFKKTSIFYLSC